MKADSESLAPGAARQILGRSELAGVDVIILHRLLKNSIDSNEYIAVTEAASRDLQLDLPARGFTSERYDDIGIVKLIVYEPTLREPV